MERTWTLFTIGKAIEDKMKTYMAIPAVKLQSKTYTGEITVTRYQRFKHLREALA